MNKLSDRVKVLTAQNPARLGAYTKVVLEDDTVQEVYAPESAAQYGLVISGWPDAFGRWNSNDPDEGIRQALEQFKSRKCK